MRAYKGTRFQDGTPEKGGGVTTDLLMDLADATLDTGRVHDLPVRVSAGQSLMIDGGSAVLEVSELLAVFAQLSPC